VTYNGFSGGGTDVFVPKLFGNGGANQSALYLQNVSLYVPNVLVEYFDEEGGYFCSRGFQMGTSTAEWLGNMEPMFCSTDLN
jgi:hypothetical protein